VINNLFSVPFLVCSLTQYWYPLDFNFNTCNYQSSVFCMCSINHFISRKTNMELECKLQDILNKTNLLAILESVICCIYIGTNVYKDMNINFYGGVGVVEIFSVDQNECNLPIEMFLSTFC